MTGLSGRDEGVCSFFECGMLSTMYEGFRSCSKVVDKCKRNRVGFMELLADIGYFFCTKICFCLYIIIYALRNLLLI